MKRFAIFATLAFQLAFLAAPAFSATPMPALERVRETERKQQQIKTQTNRVGEELDAIIAEFVNNGMAEGEDVKILIAIRKVLGKLSEDDMNKVIKLLTSARTDDSVQSRNKVAEAFGGQKTITVQLRQLLLEYERQQELYELSVRFAQLASRQNGNLKEAKRLVRAAQGRSVDRFDENQKISLSVQKDEQAAIRDESLGVINKLASLAKDTDSAVADRLNESLAQARKGKVEENLKNAVEELKAANLFRAASSQKNSRDQLRELSRLVAPTRDKEEILRQAVAELERIIIEQKGVVAKTQLLTGEAVRKTEEPFFETEDFQADVVDRTDMVKRDVEHLVPLANDQLKKGIDRMQEARSQIIEKKRTEATSSQEQAIVNLDAARKLILEELLKQEKRDETPVDKLAAAKELKEKVAELKKEQEKLKADTVAKAEPKKAAENAPPQGKLQEAAREIQPEAAQESIPAAEAIAEASREMGKAQAALENKGKLDQATVPQQAAVDALAKAEAALDKQIAQLEQAKADLNALEKAREKVEELIKNEQKIEIATAKAEAMQEPAKNDAAAKPAEANANAQNNQANQQANAQQNNQQANAQQNNQQANAQQNQQNQQNAQQNQQNAQNQNAQQQAKAATEALAKDQQANAQATEQVAQELPAAGAEAAQPLNDAKADQQQAAGDLAKNDAAAARPDEKQAIANLEKAKDALDKKIGELQQQLGQPADAQPNADLAQAIAEAQQNIAEAMQQGQGQPAQAQQGQQGEQGQPAQAQQGQQPQQGQQAQQGQQGQQGQPAQQGQQAQAAQLEKTANELAQAAAEANAPAAVDAAIAQATDALGQAAGQAQAGNQPGAQQAAGQAQEALAQAAAALALAQQGASSQAQAQGQGQPGQGQGEQPGQGEGQQPGQGQTPGQGQGQGNQPGQGQKPSQSTQEAQGQSSGDRESGRAAAADNGARANNKGQGEFIKLPPRDRKAIMQSRTQKAPSEYAPAVEQYLKNLSDSENEK